jgi:hypothetical protein
MNQEGAARPKKSAQWLEDEREDEPVEDEPVDAFGA